MMYKNGYISNLNTEYDYVVEPIKPVLTGKAKSDIVEMQMAAFSGQQGRNTRPVRAIIGGQQAA